MSLKHHIPNTLTSLNLLSGCFAIYFAFQHQYNYVAYAVFLAALFDFFDGFSARLLKVSSPIGKELDSLADMVTFGVAPAMLIFNYLINSDLPELLNSLPFLKFTPFLIAVFSGIRLAKFNIDTRQTSSFIGVPTPANALFWVSLPLLDYFPTENYLIQSTYNFLLNPVVILANSLLFSYLLVAELPLFALKFKSFGWKQNEVKFIFLITCGLLLAWLQLLAIPFIIILYILISIIIHQFNKKENEI
jgi:CDP-diacylglycerol--serine O-phosphatidyltransferase